MTALFVLVAMLPVLLLGIYFINRYAEDGRRMMISSLENTVSSNAKSAENLFSGVDMIISRIYTYKTASHPNVYDACEDPSLTEAEKSLYFNKMLSTWILSANYLSCLRFETGDQSYVVFADSTKNLLSQQAQPNLLDNSDASEYVSLQILGTTYEGDYCSNSQDYVFTIARNYMDTRSLSTSREKIVGTIYADIRVDALGYMLQEKSAIFPNSPYIIKMSTSEYIYSADSSDYGKSAAWVQEFRPEMTESSGTIYKDGHCFIYTQIGTTDCYVVSYMSTADLFGQLPTTSKYMLLVLIFTLLVLLCVYALFSDSLSRSVETLKAAMERVQAGNLSIPVSIRTKDEMQYLGEGFNRMQTELNGYIDRVYKAEIRKRDAELNALKLQIQPHYLYNTLDVIRMKALEHDDTETATLLECLSKQLRYIMGKQSDEVPLLEELNNIREYFFIIKSRFNGLYELEIDVQDSDLHLKVLKLILQPIVENAVKHGLRQKPGPGKVFIRIQREEQALKIMVMDNGKGISPQELDRIQQKLDSGDAGEAMSEQSVGLKNVYDRIHYHYGQEYGFSITGQENFGTIVTYRLPISD